MWKVTEKVQVSDNSKRPETLQRILPISWQEFLANLTLHEIFQSRTHRSPFLSAIGEPRNVVKMTEVLLLSQKISWVCRPFVLPSGYLCEQLHLADTGKLYQKVLQPFFSKLTWLNLKSKGPLSPQVGVTKHWDWLNIESCMEISLTSNIQS